MQLLILLTAAMVVVCGDIIEIKVQWINIFVYENDGYDDDGDDQNDGNISHVCCMAFTYLRKNHGLLNIIIMI